MSPPFKPAVLYLLLVLLTAQAAPASDSVDADTEALIAGGLRFLANQQAANGSWTSGPGYPVAMTGYALTAMMSTGNLPEEGDYRQNAAAAVQFLLDQVQPDGLFRGVEGGKYMYSHGIGTLALAELYGESGSPVLRPRLELLVRQIISSQSKLGGWRYTPNSRDADISVTVPQVAALRAAKEAGIAVPQATIDRAVDFIRQCFDAPSGGFDYQPKQKPGFARTAAALYSLQVCGQYDDPRAQPASAFLFAHHGDKEQWWAYGNYYAAPAQYMIGGEVWRRWYEETKAHLLATAVRRGEEVYWDDRLAQGLGPVYATAVGVTVLAVPYHYLPLYQR